MSTLTSDLSNKKNSAANSEVGENLVKHSTNVNQQEANMEQSRAFAEFLASIIFKFGSGKFLSEEKKAKKAEKLAKQYEQFMTHFGDKFPVPNGDVLLIPTKGKGKIAQSPNPCKAIQGFLKAFEIYGVDGLGLGTEVRFMGEDYPAAPKDVEGYVVTDALAFFVRCLCHSFDGLTVADKVKFLEVLNRSANAEFGQSSVTLQGVEFNLSEGTVTTAGRQLVANPTFEVDNYEFAGAHGVFFLALTCLGKSDKAINATIQASRNLFKREENYGAVAEGADPSRAIYDNFLLPVEVKASYNNVFPYFNFNSSKLEEQKLEQLLRSGELAIVDKYNMKWAAKGVAAEAALVGRNTIDGRDSIVTINDASKSEKAYNRIAMSKYLFAQAAGRAASNFTISLSNGGEVASTGVPVNTVWSNSRFGHGSGIAVINPGFSFDYTVAKTLTGVFNILTLPAKARKGISSYKELTGHVCQSINAKIFGLVGKTFPARTPVLEMTCKGIKKVIIENEMEGLPVRVKGGHAVVTSDFEIEIHLEVEVVGTGEQFVKLRGYGKKATTLPYQVDGLPEGWELMTNIESTKGWPGLIEMYCNSFSGKCYFDTHTAVLTTPEGEVDFKQVDNVFTRWCSSQMQETVVEFEMAYDCYKSLKPVIDGYDDVAVEPIIGFEDRVLVKERVQYIQGQCHFDIEVSTPKESISKTEFTLEAACGVLLQDKQLGEDLMKGMAKKLESTESLVSSFVGSNTSNLPSFNVMSQEGREQLKAVIGDARGIGFADHRAIFKVLAKAFPYGLVLQFATRDGEDSFVIHPKALATFGGFTSNGSATREIAQVIDCLFFLTDAIEGESGVDAAIVDSVISTRRVLGKWAKNLVESKKAMKKFTRCGTLWGGKVRTTYSPLCNSKDGLPVVVLNPLCPIVKGLGLDVESEEQLVGTVRVPMPFTTACYVRFSTECPVGHVFVNPVVWHYANEGK